VDVGRKVPRPHRVSHPRRLERVDRQAPAIIAQCVGGADVIGRYQICVTYAGDIDHWPTDTDATLEWR
jgi:hypothetical protein